MADETTTGSRTALRELIETIEEIDARYLGTEGRATTPAEIMVLTAPVSTAINTG